MMGSDESSIARDTGGCRRCERDLSDLLDCDLGSLRFSGGEYVGVGFGDADEESVLRERAETCLLLGGGGSSAPSSSSACKRS